MHTEYCQWPPEPKVKGEAANNSQTAWGSLGLNSDLYCAATILDAQQVV